jgi:DNA-binding YbaB/EbfC family protein
MTDADPQPGAGGFDLGSLLGAASQMFEAQAQAAQQAVVGSAGGGAVKITVTGGGEFTAVELAPDVVDPADVPMLEDLVLAALRDAMAKVQQLQSGALGGLDMGGLQGLLGGAALPRPDDGD